MVELIPFKARRNILGSLWSQQRFLLTKKENFLKNSCLLKMNAKDGWVWTLKAATIPHILHLFGQELVFLSGKRLKIM